MVTQALYTTCLLYTSDAADEEDSGDTGGRRIIKKKKQWETQTWQTKDKELNELISTQVTKE